MTRLTQNIFPAAEDTRTFSPATTVSSTSYRFAVAGGSAAIPFGVSFFRMAKKSHVTHGSVRV